MTTRTNTTRIQILQQARAQIADNKIRHICFALDNIADLDHRRAIQQHCKYLITRFKSGLDGRDSLVGWLVDQRLQSRKDIPIDPDTLVLARLAWIDKTIEELSK